MGWLRLSSRLSAILLLIPLSGCSWEWAHRIYPIPFYETGVTVEGEPERLHQFKGRIAVLPFTFDQDDNLERENAVLTLRESFCTAAERLRTYDYVPAADLDARLSKAGIGLKDIPAIAPSRLGEIAGAELLLYGDVKRTRNLTLYLYSHTVYEGTFRLVEARTGDLLWSGRLWEGRRGGLFVDLFLIDMFMEQPKNRELSEAYRSVSMDMARKLVDTIPDPSTHAPVSEESP